MDDWAITECDYCGEYRKCYNQDDKYLCAGEDCKQLQYFYGSDDYE